jgi:hypothetical protein
MRTLTVFLLAAFLAAASTAFATDRADRQERSAARNAPPAAADPYPTRTQEAPQEERDRTDEGLLGRILPTGDTIWNYLVTAALITVIAVIWWIFFSMSLKGACWFSLVEASLFRCGVLSIAITGLGLICFGTAAHFQGIGANMWAPSPSGGLSLLAAAGIYLGIAITLTKLLLKCKWRSVVTVWIMSTFVAAAIVCCTYAGIVAALPAEAAPIPLP